MTCQIRTEANGEIKLERGLAEFQNGTTLTLKMRVIVFFSVQMLSILLYVLLSLVLELAEILLYVNGHRVPLTHLLLPQL